MWEQIVKFFTKSGDSFDAEKNVFTYGQFDFFDLMLLLGGLAVFMFGMNLMGQALERTAGSKLKTIIGKFTTNRLAGLATGLGVTASDEAAKYLKLIGDFERISDHCSNIAACIIDTSNNRLDLHEIVREVKGAYPEYSSLYNFYLEKYALPTSVLVAENASEENK